MNNDSYNHTQFYPSFGLSGILWSLWKSGLSKTQFRTDQLTSHKIVPIRRLYSLLALLTLVYYVTVIFNRCSPAISSGSTGHRLSTTPAKSAG